MNVFAHRLAVCGTLAALLATAGLARSASSVPAIPAQVAASDERSSDAAPQGLVDIGGRRLMLNCVGRGTPTVVLEAGSGDTSATWAMVQADEAPDYRVCSYDRANLGASDPAPRPRTLVDMARDLHTLLVNADVDGPFVLVGHSMGGLLVRVFADEYPGDVVGLVLVDSAHPDMGTRLLARLPPESPSEPAAIKAARQYLRYLVSGGTLAEDAEGVDLPASYSRLKAARPLGRLPLAVVSRSPDNPGFGYIPPLPEDVNAGLRRIWQGLQAELPSLTTDSTWLIAARAGHFVQWEESGLVTAAMDQVVSKARRQMGIASAPGETTDHPPVILGITERRGSSGSTALVHKDIRFSDSGGDARIAVNKLISSTRPIDVLDDKIQMPSDKQKAGAMLTSTWGCDDPYSALVEYTLVDRAGNHSEPVTVAVHCRADAPAQGAFPMIMGLGAGLGLLAAGVVLVRWRHARRAACLQTRGGSDI